MIDEVFLNSIIDENVKNYLDRIFNKGEDINDIINELISLGAEQLNVLQVNLKKYIKQQDNILNNKVTKKYN